MLNMTESGKEKKSDRLSYERFFSRSWACLLPGVKAQLIFWLLVAIGLTLDLWSKNAVFNWLDLQSGNRVSVIDGFLHLVRTENPGAAFGIAAGLSYLLVAVSAVALIAILVVFFLSGSQQKLMQIALAFFAAGICGNLYDRIFNSGLVRDFIDVMYWPGRHWPAFNVADSLLCIGVGLLLISTFRSPKRTG